MIERTNAFKVGDQSFLTLADAQKFELKELWTKSVGSSSNTTDSVVDWVITNRIKILDILTTTSASKPKARKINGGSKPRRVVAPPKTNDLNAAYANAAGSPLIGIKEKNLSKVVLTGPVLDDQ